MHSIDGKTVDYGIQYSEAQIKLLEIIKGTAKVGDVVKAKCFNSDEKELEKIIKNNKEFIVFLKSNGKDAYINLMPFDEAIKIVDGKTKINEKCRIFKDGSTKEQFIKELKVIIEPLEIKSSEKEVPQKQLEAVYRSVTVADSGKSTEDIGKIIFNNYLKGLKDSKISDGCRLRKYEIEEIKIEKQGKTGFEFTVEYEVLPMYPSKYVMDGKSCDNEECEWMHNIISYIKVSKKNSTYILTSVSSETLERSISDSD